MRWVNLSQPIVPFQLENSSGNNKRTNLNPVTGWALSHTGHWRSEKKLTHYPPFKEALVSREIRDTQDTFIHLSNIH